MIGKILGFWGLSTAVIWASQPKPWQIWLQDPATPVMENTRHVHHMLLAVIIVIAILVTVLIAAVIWRFRESKNPVPSTKTHNTLLEIIWTTVPALILIALGIPSIRILYENDKAHNPDMTVKAIGHQWYWSYEVKDGDKEISFDSYMIEDKDIKPGQLRLLEVDNRVVVPVGAKVQLLTTSTDVIHSWTVPSFGIKKDSVPGRINETWFQVKKEGVYYGQCSELCGAKHGFMPIVVEAVSKERYQEYMAQKAKKS